MAFEQIEKLKSQLTDKYVVVDDSRPELRRFRGMTGVVKTVNMNGRALVQFLGGASIAWFDIDPSFLRIVEAPVAAAETAARHAAEHKKSHDAEARPTARAEPSKKVPTSTEEILAAARAAKKPESAPPTHAASASGALTTAEILARARGQKPATTPQTESVGAASGSGQAPAGESPRVDPSKLTTAEILAMARGQKPATAKPTGPAGEKTPAAPAKPSTPTLDTSKLSTAEILALARGQKPAAAAAAPTASPSDETRASQSEVPKSPDAIAQLLEAARRPKSSGSATMAPQPIPEAETQPQPAGAAAIETTTTSDEGSAPKARPDVSQIKTLDDILAFCRSVDRGRRK